MMIHKLKTYFILLLFLSSCIKEDLSTIADVQVNAEWIIPLVDLSLGVLDILPEDEHIVVDEDSLLRVIYRDENIKTIMGDSLLQFSGEQFIERELIVGIVDLDDFESTIGVSLGSMTNEMNPAIAEPIIQAAALPLAYFPPLNSVFGGAYSYEAFDNFEYLDIATGTLYLELYNTLAIEIEGLNLGLMNVVSQEIIAEFTFSDIAVGEVVGATVELEGVTLFNELSIVILEFTSPGSGLDPGNEASWLSFDLSDEIICSIYAQNMTVHSGNIVFPDIELDADTSSIAFDLADDVVLSQIDFSAGILDISYNSTVHHPIEVLVEIPNLFLDGSSFTEVIIIENTEGTGEESISWALGGSSIELTDNSNEILFYYLGNIDSNGNLLDFDSEDFVHLNISLTGMEFSYVQGYFGQQIEVVTEGSVAIDTEFIDRFSDGVSLVDPKLYITAASNVGIPIELNLDFEGQTDSEIENLNAFPFNIEAPSLFGGYAIVSTITEFNSMNSSIVELVNIHPHTMVFSGEVLTNPNGEVEPNFIHSGSEIVVGFEMDIPVDISVDNLILSDTMDVSIEEINDLDHFGLRAFISNGFPLSADIELFFVDSINNTVLDSLIIQEISAGEVNAVGDVESAAVLDIILAISNDRMEAIIEAHKVYAEVKMSSMNTISSSVKIYTDYRFNLALGLVLDIESGGQ
jgi:hypothetical protein